MKTSDKANRRAGKKKEKLIKGAVDPSKVMGKKSSLFLDQTDKNENSGKATGIDFEKM